MKSQIGIAWNIHGRRRRDGTHERWIAYLLEGLPQDRQLHLALEWNFAGLPSGADDRYFYDAWRSRSDDPVMNSTIGSS